MADQVNISQELDRLMQLQAIDSQLYKMNAEKEAKPAEIQQMKDALAHKQSDLKDAEAVLKSLQVKRKEKELDLESKEEEIKKFQKQLYQIKTNKEYTAMLHEIEGHKADNSVLEEEILKIMEEIDVAQAKVVDEKKKFEEITKNTDADIKSIEIRGKEIETASADLNKKRDGLATTVDQKTLKTYEKILAGKDGHALVEIVNDSCGGCYMSLPPQVINEVRLKEYIVLCDNCQRILYTKNGEV